MNLRLLLSQHDIRCTKCTRSGNCKLQTLTNDYNLLGEHYIKDLKQTQDDFPTPWYALKTAACGVCAAYRCATRYRA